MIITIIKHDKLNIDDRIIIKPTITKIYTKNVVACLFMNITTAVRAK